MRPSFVSLALIAGVLVLSQARAAKAAAPCCPAPDVSELKESNAPDEGGAEADEVLPLSADAAPAPTPLNLSPRSGVDRTSYRDVFGILKAANACSRFFGGARTAAAVFNQFVSGLREKPLGPSSVAIKMWGDYTNYLNASTGASYRLFEKAAVNSQGPLPARASGRATVRLRVGRFPADTRQAKALILLHELGHLIRGKDGKWLLPEDGSDADRSEQNTQAIQSRCYAQLLALRE